MKDIIEKLSSYNIFNYLLPGILFMALGDQLTSFSLIQNNLFVGMFLFYFVGMIISRIGSLTVEPFLKCIGFVRFSSYNDYVEASKSDPKLELFSEQNNVYRTLCSLSILLILLKIYDKNKDLLPWNTDTSFLILMAGILVLFLFSYRKQTKYIVHRVNFNKG